MLTETYIVRRAELKTYFDRTAVEAWSRLTSDAPVGRIRATVRAGREQMRSTLLSWLPDDLTGKTLLDAGCGTGVLAVEAARRGAIVTAVDISPTLVDLARERAQTEEIVGSVDFQVGDMLSEAHGRFDHIVAMDSLIHYTPEDTVKAVAGLASRTEASILMTFAPRTPALTAMHMVGRWFPKSDRAPAIEPVTQERIQALLIEERLLAGWVPARTHRVATGFYTSQALEICRR